MVGETSNIDRLARVGGLLRHAELHLRALRLLHRNRTNPCRLTVPQLPGSPSIRRRADPKFSAVTFATAATCRTEKFCLSPFLAVFDELRPKKNELTYDHLPTCAGAGRTKYVSPDAEIVNL